MGIYSLAEVWWFISAALEDNVFKHHLQVLYGQVKFRNHRDMSSIL